MDAGLQKPIFPIYSGAGASKPTRTGPGSTGYDSYTVPVPGEEFVPSATGTHIAGVILGVGVGQAQAQTAGPGDGPKPGRGPEEGPAPGPANNAPMTLSFFGQEMDLGPVDNLNAWYDSKSGTMNYRGGEGLNLDLENRDAALSAWNLAGPSEGPVVAIIGGAVDLEHPDLKGRIHSSADLT